MGGYLLRSGRRAGGVFMINDNVIPSELSIFTPIRTRPGSYQAFFMESLEMLQLREDS